MKRNHSPLAYWTTGLWWATWGAIRELTGQPANAGYIACLFVGGFCVFMITRHMEGSAA